jgi:hypothetical protein
MGELGAVGADDHEVQVALVRGRVLGHRLPLWVKELEREPAVVPDLLGA